MIHEMSLAAGAVRIDIGTVLILVRQPVLPLSFGRDTAGSLRPGCSPYQQAGIPEVMRGLYFP